MEGSHRPGRSVRTSRQRPSQTPPQPLPVRVPGFPPDLPVSAKREEIARAIRDHQVVIVCGETGSGKTTQLPKICLAMGRGCSGKGIIGHTQPRRIAARSVAARIADELQSPLGKHVGYKIRFTDTLTRGASVKIMTDGILLAETRRDPQLRAYDTIIIDEAHERSLNIDFLLGYLKRLLPRRSDLKVVITSATIDPQRFSDHFSGDGGPRNVPIVEVSGRTYPVEVRYRPLVSDDPDAEDRDLRQGVLDSVNEALGQHSGDVLVFLSGEREIRELTKALTGHVGDSVEVLPLYARLTTEEQNRIFAPHNKRRVILATNVAETSLTVPGIRSVIDSGRARMSRYSARSGVQRLPIEPISRASAEQRKGRCGRLGPGVCFRLYSEEDYLSREHFTPPEILRTNLASVILQMKALRLGRVEDFPFVEPPRWAMITDGYSTLHELGAIDEWGEITPLGEELARLPIDPRLGRMVLAAREEGCLNDVLVIAAALSIQDPRERPHEKQQAADEAHREFRDENSDFVTLLNIWRFFHAQSKELAQSRLRKVCRDRFLSFVRLREWVDVHHQLRDLIAEAEVTLDGKPAQTRERRKRRGEDDYDSLHRAILSGLLSRIGVKHPETHEYTGAHGRKFHIFPGSGQFKQPPQWVMATEIVETTKTYAHTVARISPKWIERIAGHLVKRRHAEPHWRERTADVAALETVTLFGLEIAKDRRVPYGPIDPKTSRDIFIRSALVEGRYRTNARFFAHNQNLISEIRSIEDRVRRRGVLVDDERLFAFYNSHVPEGIYSGAAFEAWRKKAEKANPALLFLSREQLLADAGHGATTEKFPDNLDINNARLPLSYRFEPGHEDDGVTITVPVAMLDQLSNERLEWLVPGLLEEKVAALVKALPKSIRRNFAPGSVPQLAGACVERLSFGEGSLTSALAEALHRITGIEIPLDSWNEVDLPPYLRMNVRVVDDEGKVVAKARDLGEISGRVRSATRGVASPCPGLQPAQLFTGTFRAWTFGELPATITIKRGGIDVTAYPAIIDQGDAVSIQALQTPQQAQRETRKGLRRLVMLQHPREIKELAHHLPNVDRMALDYAALGHGGGADLARELLEAVVDHAFIERHAGEVRSKQAFDLMVSAGWHHTAAALREVSDAVGRALATAMILRNMLDELAAPQVRASADEIRSHLDHLLRRGFITSTTCARLSHVPRYLEGARRRIVKITSGKLSRDRQLAAEFAPFWKRYLDRETAAARQGLVDPALEEHRWMLEELRIALFAQELGTAVRVSPKRVEEHWRTIGSAQAR